MTAITEDSIVNAKSKINAYKPVTDGYTRPLGSIKKNRKKTPFR